MTALLPHLERRRAELLEARKQKKGGGGKGQEYDIHTGQWVGAGGADLPARLKERGGFTLDPRTGTFVNEGIAVAIEGHTEIMSVTEFADDDKGRQFVRDYVHKMARSKPSAGTMVGGWLDTEHNEIVLDWTEVFTDRYEGIQAGRQRDQMAVYDLAADEEIPTGGTGDRERILSEARAAGRRQANQADVGDDRRGARPAGRWPLRRDEGQAEGQAKEGLSLDAELELAGWSACKVRLPPPVPDVPAPEPTVGPSALDLELELAAFRYRRAQPAVRPSIEEDRARTTTGLKKGGGGRPQLYGQHGQYAKVGAWDAAIAQSPGYQQAVSTRYDSPDAPRLAADLANTIVDAARVVEPEITKEITTVAAKAGATMFGLEFRIKENTERIAEKILQTSAEDGVTLAEAAGGISDPVRYTFHVAPNDYVPSFQTVQAELESDGYAMRVKNYWPPGDAYNGVNVAVTSPAGVPIEVQFHTPASQRIKDQVHLQYEEYRKPTTPTPRRISLWEQMVKTSDNQVFPPNWEMIPGRVLAPAPTGYRPIGVPS